LLKEVKESVKYKSRRIRRDFAVYRQAKSTWMKDILECQNEDANSNPHPAYLDHYRRQELYYWMKIPNWIRQDSLQNKVKRSLDIGCAYGTLALYCKKIFNCEAYAVDYVDTYLSPTLVGEHHLFFDVCNIELDDLPWNTKFDVITLTEVLEHFNFNPLPTLKKIRALLSQNGRLYLSTPDAAQWGRVTKYYSSIDEMPMPKKGLQAIDDHVYQYTKKELLSVLEAAGFRVERFSYSPGVTSRHFNLTVTR
jgi:SAM-dependent methyltransferase